MLVYHDILNLKLDQYGIGVPLKNSRDQKTFEFLSLHFPDRIKMTALEEFPEISRRDLELVHHPGYVAKLYGSKQSLAQQIDLTYELDQGYSSNPNRRDDQKLFETIIWHCRGVLLTMQKAYLHPQKFCYFLGGGMHHAMSFGGRGFCLVNDGVIALEKMKKQFDLKSVWVIDVDAHKGDGTAELAQKRDWLHTLSLHMGESWPFGQEGQNAQSPWLIPSDIDVPLLSGQEEQYLDLLESSLKEMERRFSRPDLVWVLAGADVYQEDELPSAKAINLSKEQVFERDLLIYEFFHSRSIAQGWCLAGGYGERTWEIPSQFLEQIFTRHPQ